MAQNRFDRPYEAKSSFKKGSSRSFYPSGANGAFGNRKRRSDMSMPVSSYRSGSVANRISTLSEQDVPVRVQVMKQQEIDSLVSPIRKPVVIDDQVH